METLISAYPVISMILTIVLSLLKIIEMIGKLPPQFKGIISKPWLPWGLTVILFLSLVAMIYQGMKSMPQPAIVDMPLATLQSYDFEETKGVTDTRPWFSIPTTQTHTSLISDNESFAHTGTKSYQLVVDMEPYLNNVNMEYAGIGLTEDKFTDVKMISAWVLIPDSEPVRNKNFLSHILAYKYDDTGEPIDFASKDTKIEPGQWTQLVIGTFQNSQAIPNFIWNGDIDELYISIWCDQEYSGSIYIDDVVLYR